MRNLSIKTTILILLVMNGSFLTCKSQTSKNSTQPQLPRKGLSGMAAAANDFLQGLTAKQKDAIQFSFDDNERLNWHYVPKSRNGVPLKDLSGDQRESAMKL